MKPNSRVFFCAFFLFCAVLYGEESPATNTVEASRLATIHYGTETEIASLIQSLKTEGADYLDTELISLVDTTRNQKILSGVFAFFGYG